ncbi:MAG: VWA domain-containing protein [Bryobacteraceae bacterium]
MMLFITAFFILLPAFGQDAKVESSPPPMTFRSGVSNVRMDVQVIEGTNVVADLTKDDFAVFDDKQQQRILYFGRDAEPVSLLLLLDVSGSMKKYVEQIASVAREALHYLKQGDKVAVMIFSKGTIVRKEFTTDLDAVARDLSNLSWDERLESGTAINEALVDASRYMREHAGEAGRRAILILTDNLGLNYLSPDEKVIRSLYEADAVMNAMVAGKGERPEPIRPGRYANPDFTPPDVFHIADETGGEAIKVGRASATFPEMIERIRTRYSLQFHTPEIGPAGFRTVRVELTPQAKLRHPKAEVHARKGYFLTR